MRAVLWQQWLAWRSQILSVEFWENLLEGFALLGPLVPILLACIESLIPALPLVAIVALNVVAHGPFWGFVYSWLGSCVGCLIVFLFYRCVLKKPFGYLIAHSPRAIRAKGLVSRFDVVALFLLICMPFTPSSFLNFAFGISDYSAKRYLTTLAGAKLIMIGLLATFGQTLSAARENPLILILSVGLLALLYWLSVLVRKRSGL